MPGSLSQLYQRANLLNDRGDDARTDGVATLADSEAQALLHGDRVDEVALDGDVVTRHSHLGALGELDRTGNVGGTEVELRTITIEERGVTAALLLGQNIDLAGELGVRGNRTGLAENLAALDVLALDAAEQQTDVVASLAEVHGLTEHLDTGNDGVLGILDADDLDGLVELELTALDTAGSNSTTAGDGHNVLNGHQEREVVVTSRRRDVLVDGVHELADSVHPLGVALESAQSGTTDDGDVVAGEIVLGEELTGLHLDEVDELVIVNHVALVQEVDGALLIVSHDRHFLDQVVDKIWELKDGGISEFWGDYSDYLRQKEEERKVQAARYEEAMRERKRLEAAIEKQRKKARQVDAKQKGAKKSNEYAGRLGHQKATGTKQKRMYQAAKNMEKRLEALEGIEAPDSIRTVRFRQSKALELHSKFPISADDFSLSFDGCVLYDHAKFEIPLGAKVAITGGNGTGKTSLLKAIARRADGINISPKAEIGYFEQTGYKFDARQPAISFMQDGCEYSMTEIRGILASMGIGPRDLTKDVGVLSGGEVIKLLLAKMLLGRYNILLMDEPGNYLDVKSTEALEQMMSAYAGTIVFVTHDKRLVENVADIVYEIKDTKLVKIFQRE